MFRRTGEPPIHWVRSYGPVSDAAVGVRVEPYGTSVSPSWCGAWWNSGMSFWRNLYDSMGCYPWNGDGYSFSTFKTTRWEGKFLTKLDKKPCWFGKLMGITSWDVNWNVVSCEISEPSKQKRGIKAYLVKNPYRMKADSCLEYQLYMIQHSIYSTCFIFDVHQTWP